MTDSLLIGLIAGVVTIGAIWLVAIGRKPSFDLKVRRSGELASALSPGEVIAKLQAAAPGERLKVEIVEDGRILLSQGTSLLSFGHFIPITAEAAGGRTRVTVGTATKVPQYGPVVSRNHGKIMDKVKRALGISA